MPIRMINNEDSDTDSDESEGSDESKDRDRSEDSSDDNDDDDLQEYDDYYSPHSSTCNIMCISLSHVHHTQISNVIHCHNLSSYFLPSTLVFFNIRA